MVLWNFPGSAMKGTASCRHRHASRHHRWPAWNGRDSAIDDVWTEYLEFFVAFHLVFRVETS